METRESVTEISRIFALFFSLQQGIFLKGVMENRKYGPNAGNYIF